MGFFSWNTADTQESIPNNLSGQFNGRVVFMLQPNGAPVITESAYKGYGVFGGVDAFIWLAENNLPAEDLEDLNKDMRREAGIDLSLSKDQEKIKLPLKFSFNPAAIYENMSGSSQCPYQGYFYNDEEEDAPDFGRIRVANREKPGVRKMKDHY